VLEEAGVEPRVSPILREVRVGTVLPVEVRVESDHLVLIYDTEGPTAFRHPNPKGLLNSFLKISSDKPETLRRFILRYGSLRICHDHRRPQCAICRGDSAVYYGKELNKLSRKLKPYLAFSENLSSYYVFADLARKVTDLCGKIMKKEVMSISEWDELKTTLREVGKIKDNRVSFFTAVSEVEIGYEGLQIQRHAAAFIIEEWLEMDPLCPQISHDFQWITGNKSYDTPSVEILVNTMGAIGLQLLSLLIDKSLAQCDGCLNFYQRKLTENRQRKNYCPACRDDGTAERLRKRAQRARRRLQPN
jgi:hypothetical protein